MTRTPLLPVCLLALLGGCAKLPPPAPPPPYQGLIDDHPAHCVYLRDREADARIAAGISSRIEGDWRWASRRAELRLAVDETQGIHFQATLVVPEPLLQAGGRKIDVRIDGRLLGSIPVEQTGYLAWKQPVPEGWLERGREIRVELTADAEYEEGRQKRSYALGSAGFTP